MNSWTNGVTIEIRERTDELVFAVHGFRGPDEMQRMCDLLTAAPDAIEALADLANWDFASIDADETGYELSRDRALMALAKAGVK